MAYLVEMLNKRKTGATAPPFSGVITDLTGNPADLSAGVTNVKFRVGTPGTTPIIDANVTLTDAPNGEWEYKPSTGEADALTPGEHLVHLIINWDNGDIEPVPADHYFKLQVLELL